MTNTFAYQALVSYQLRWSIETFFQSIKQRGFRLESNHLDDPPRLRKLSALVAIAFTVCLHIGRWSDQFQKPIEIKNHGYKANSFFRHGLECWRRAIRIINDELDLFIQVIQQALEPPIIDAEKSSCRVVQGLNHLALISLYLVRPIGKTSPLRRRNIYLLPEETKISATSLILTI